MIDDRPDTNTSGGLVQRTVRNFSAAAFKATRVRAGRSLADLADLSGLGVSTLSGWERGIVVPTIPSLKAAADALDVDVAELVKKPQGKPTLFDTRIALGMTIEQVASAAGLSRHTISRAENGHGSLSPATADALANLYDLEAADIREAWTRTHAARLRRLRGSA